MPAAQSLSGKAFKYERLKIRVHKTYVIIGGLLVVSIGGVYQRGLHQSGVIVLTMLWSFMLYQVIRMLLGASDVVVDEEGISRRLFGWVWKKIRWDNVSRIYSFEAYDQPSGILLSAYNVFPIVKDRIHIYPSGKIAFLGTVNSVNELIKIINKHASEYHIPLQAKQGGKITAVDQLTFSSRRPGAR